MNLPRLLCILILSFTCYFSKAQVITISGKVTDKETGTTLPGASIRSGNFGTSTNVNGEFHLVLDKEIAAQNGLSFSFIGYQKVQIAFNGTNYAVKLIPLANKLKEVVISGSGETILDKAIRKIPENYPDKDFMMNGLLRMMHTSKDSTGYQYYYKNEANLRLYYPAYTNHSRPDVSLIQKKDTLTSNPNSTADIIRWVGGYNGFTYADYVHNRNEMLSGNYLKRFVFSNNGKDWVDGSRVYVINFYTKSKKDNAGTLYIDTATYAFVRITNTLYNLKPSIGIPIDKATTVVDYKSINGKWYLNTVKVNNISRHDPLDIYRIEEFDNTGIDLVNVKPLPFIDVVPHFTEDVKIKPAAIPLAADSSAVTTKKDAFFTNVKTLKIDTLRKKQSFGKRAFAAVASYYLNDNIRVGLGFSSSPVNASGYQPLLGKTIGGASKYNIDQSYLFRLYKGLFVEFGEQKNYGIGGIKSDQNTYYLTYNFEFNKLGHAIALSPVAGYTTISLKKDKTQYYNSDNWAFGLNMAYTLSYRWRFFIEEKYYKPTSTNNSGLALNLQKFATNAGFLFMLKL